MGRMLDSKFNVSLSAPMGLTLVFHWTWLLCWAFVSTYGLTWAFIYPCVFGIVILHELGHCYAARQYNLPIQNILIFPFGACAQIDLGMPTPKKEFVVTVAGPLVNVALILPLLLTSTLLQGVNVFGKVSYVVAYVNCGMLIFNLLPAFPMDGGRLLRAGLLAWLKCEYKATLIAARVSQFIAAAGAVLAAWMGMYVTVILAFFVCMTAEAELNRIMAALGMVVERGPATSFKVTVKLTPWKPTEKKSRLDSTLFRRGV